MADLEFTEHDEGKRVVDAEGDTIGLVSEVRAQTAYVDPDPDLMDRVRSKLGWGEADEESYPLDKDDVVDITDDEITVQRF